MPITVNGTRPLEIGRDGTVTQDGVAVGKLEVVDFANTAALSKQGSSYFRATDPAQRPTAASGTTVEQGQLEASNTGSAEAAVRSVEALSQTTISSWSASPSRSA